MNSVSHPVAHLIVRRLSTNEEVHRVPLSDIAHRFVERVILGMLRNMNREEYYVDESEVDAAREAMGAGRQR